MLYPREDRQSGTLAFQCRHCQYMEEAGATCIYRNELANNVGETSGVTQDVASDPTVGDPIPSFCTLCSQEIVCVTCGDALDTGTHLEVVEGEIQQGGIADSNQTQGRELDEDDDDDDDEGYVYYAGHAEGGQEMT